MVVSERVREEKAQGRCSSQVPCDWARVMNEPLVYLVIGSGVQKWSERTLKDPLFTFNLGASWLPAGSRMPPSLRALRPSRW